MTGRARRDSIACMPIAASNGIEICYETLGDTSGPPLLLIMGFGSQLVRWPPKFLTELEQRGYHVIVFDNRDVGKSTHLDALGNPDLSEIMAGTAELPYSIGDMADDAAGLLDALELESAHVLGVSMGGMIAQDLAIRHPARVRSLTSVMSTTGRRDLPPPKPEILRILMRAPATTRQEEIEIRITSDRAIGGQLYPFEEEMIRKRAAEAYDRGFNPIGRTRQFAAISMQLDRREALAKLRMPVAVIHGADDPLVSPQGGRDTADAIPGAVLTILKGMGHDLPGPLHGQIADALDAVVARAAG